MKCHWIKMNVIFLVFLFGCCTNKPEKSIETVNVNVVRLDPDYGSLYKSYKLQQTTIRSNDTTTFIYNDNFYKTIDTIKLFSNKFSYNRQVLKLVDTKKLVVNKEVTTVYKLFSPHIGAVGADNYGGQLFYINDKGVIIRHFVISNTIAVQRPELYNDLLYNILYKKINFKSHHED